MTVYIDKARHPYLRMIMCHMIADSVEELHEFAKQIGLKPEWFQPLSYPHYDLSISRRKKAIELGAVILDRRQFALKMRELRSAPDACSGARPEEPASGRLFS